ncbi:MAG TPA: response regulator [Thermoanaerobaculia bacterium]
MPNATVLVVEDDETIRRLLTEYLQAHSHVEVESARDGVEALHQISTRPYDVVVLDVMMPKMSGVDLLDSLATLRRDDSVQPLKSLPAVLVITSVSDGEVPDRVLKEHCPELVRGVFRKPLELGALAEEVERYLR